MYSRVGLIDQSRSYVFDSTTLTWVASPPPGGAGISSTQVAVSSVAGTVGVAPVSSSGVSMSTDTDPASTKQGLIVRQVGLTIDSSGALQVNTGPGGSTQVAISSGIVQTQPQSSNATSFYSVRISDGSTFVTPTTTVSISSGIVQAQPISSSGVSMSTDAAQPARSRG